MKRIKLFFQISLTLAVIISFFLAKPIYQYLKRNAANQNTVEVQVSSDLNIKDYSIRWGSIEDQQKVIFENGNDTDTHYKRYGKNRFYVYEKDSLIAQFGQFKYNNWHGHLYTFNISKSGDKANVTWKVYGPDSDRTFETDLVPD